MQYVHCRRCCVWALLGALSVNANMWESIELVPALGSALLRKCGSRATYLKSAVGPTFFTPHIDVACARHWFGEVKGFPQISRLLQVPFHGAPVNLAPSGDLEAKLAHMVITLVPTHTREGRFAPRLLRMP